MNKKITFLIESNFFINLFKKLQKGGPRGTILHYIKNNQIVQNDSLLLMDAGCQYRDYSSDVNFILNN